MNEKQHIKKSLDKMADNLDQNTLNQLDRLRRQVINNNPTKWYEKMNWPMLGPVLAAMVLVIVFYISNSKQTMQNYPNFDDLELLANEADTELLEDLEFIAWLDEEKVFEGELL